jgi:hypothetical protein
MFMRTLRPIISPLNGIRRFSEQAAPKYKQKPVAEPSTEVLVRKSNLKQSPLRMKFLAMLIRKLWLPDALAQLKFSPKHRAVDLSKILKVLSKCLFGSSFPFIFLLFDSYYLLCFFYSVEQPCLK